MNLFPEPLPSPRSNHPETVRLDCEKGELNFCYFEGRDLDSGLFRTLVFLVLGSLVPLPSVGPSRSPSPREDPL